MTAPSRRYLPAERIWGRGRRDGTCLMWTAGTSSGYGSISLNGRQERVHRVAWMLAHGRRIPRGRMVVHACDRKLCFSPGCLRLGSAATNARDAVARGRTARGERHWNARLTEADVEAIRAKRQAGHVLQRELASEYGVTRSAIAGIVRGETWTHLLPGAA